LARFKTAEAGSAFDQHPKAFHVYSVKIPSGGKGATQYASPTIRDPEQSDVLTEGLATEKRVRLIPAFRVMLPHVSPDATWYQPPQPSTVPGAIVTPVGGASKLVPHLVNSEPGKLGVLVGVPGTYVPPGGDAQRTDPTETLASRRLSHPELIQLLYSVILATPALIDAEMHPSVG